MSADIAVLVEPNTVAVATVDTSTISISVVDDDTVSVAVESTTVGATVEETTIQVEVSTGPEGPPGPQGPPGSGANFDLTYTAGQNLSGQRVVTFIPGTGWVYADRTNPSHAGMILAVTLGAIMLGEDGAARLGGPMDEVSWSWPFPGPLYVDTMGLMTMVPPTSGFLREVARAVSAQRIVIEPEPAIILA